MENRTERIVWRAIWRAAGNRTTLVGTALTAASGIVFHSGTLVVIAAFGWATAMVVNLTRGRLWREAVTLLDCEPIELPPENSLQAAAARTFLARLNDTRIERAAIRLGLDPCKFPGARGMAARTGDMERAALALILALDRIESYLESAGAMKLATEVERLQRQPEDLTHPAARDEADQARLILQGRKKTTAEIESMKALIVARLESILAALEALPPRLLRTDVWHSILRVLQDDTVLARLQEEMAVLDVSARATMDELADDTTSEDREVVEGRRHGCLTVC